MSTRVLDIVLWVSSAVAIAAVIWLVRVGTTVEVSPPLADPRAWPPFILMLLALGIGYMAYTVGEAKRFSWGQALIGVLITILTVVFTAWVSGRIFGK